MLRLAPQPAQKQHDGPRLLLVEAVHRRSVQQLRSGGRKGSEPSTGGGGGRSPGCGAGTGIERLSITVPCRAQLRFARRWHSAPRSQMNPRRATGHIAAPNVFLRGLKRTVNGFEAHRPVPYTYLPRTAYMAHPEAGIVSPPCMPKYRTIAHNLFWAPCSGYLFSTVQVDGVADVRSCSCFVAQWRPLMS
jgi:hypothetical protein